MSDDGSSFRIEQKWKEEVIYWEGEEGFSMDAGWGVTPPVLYVPSAEDLGPGRPARDA